MTGCRRISQKRARSWAGLWVQQMVGAIWRLVLMAVLIINWTPATAEATTPPTDLTELSLEQLMGIEITSASKKEEPLWDSAAAVFVITGEDIRRAGMKSIPEALRLAPGLQVAQFGSNRWAISARGFNATFSNKLLVLIDGRSVYTPLFAGVFWDVQDTLIEDIDRIEIIRGPGGTLWGANAVNGVINIITKTSKDTHGALVSAGGGNVDQGTVAFRYGDGNSKNLDY